MHRFLVPAASILLLGACAGASSGPASAPTRPSAAAAPEPAADASRAAPPATASVARIAVEPSAVTLTVGDTASVEVAAVDARGRGVTNARVASQGGEGLVWARPMGNGRALLYAVRPGSATMLFRAEPGEAAAGSAPEARLDLRIEDRPVERVAWAVPAGDTLLFAGTSTRFRADALTAFGLPRQGTAVAFRSSAPAVLEVGASGFARALAPGTATVSAIADGVRADVTVEVRANPAASIALSPERATARTGDVVRFDADVLDERGRPIADARPTFAVAGGDDAGEASAMAYSDGAFVAENPGTYTVVASFGELAAQAVVVVEPREVGRQIVALDRVGHPWTAMTDLWVFEGSDGRDYAYTGTKQPGSRMYAWDVTDPNAIVLRDSVIVDARTVNDVKISPDASFAVITREGASNRRNGIVILDTSDPAHPTVASSFTEGLTGGVHNAWIYDAPDGRAYVYAINDGTRDVHIVDVTDIRNPTAAGRWGIDREGKTLHDVFIKDGLAYLSYWDDGLFILDVGAGVKGGTPTEPVPVGSIKYPAGNTHTAYRYGNYVFVGDEIFDSPEAPGIPRGYIHVIDVTDLENPVEVAKYEVPEAGAHNIWIEDDVMYVAYYQAGLRVVDVSGELRGDLYRQGREMAKLETATSAEDGAWFANQSRVWGPQPYKGVIFASDKYSGLWAARLIEPEPDKTTTD